MNRDIIIKYLAVCWDSNFPPRHSEFRPTALIWVWSLLPLNLASASHQQVPPLLEPQV